MTEDQATAAPAAEVERIKTTVTDVVREASAIAITTDEELQVAAEFLRVRVKAVLKEIDLTFDPIVRRAHETHKEALAQKARHAGPLLAAEKALKRVIGDYQAAEKRRLAEERRRLEAEARETAERERLAEAERLEAEGHTEEAEAALNAPIIPEAVPVREAATVRGVSTRVVWKFRIINADLVGRDFCSPNEPAIASLVGKMGEKAAGIIGGIEVYQDTVVSSRAG